MLTFYYHGGYSNPAATKWMKVIPIVFLIFSLGGCAASLNEFQEMSSYERTKVTCENTTRVKGMSVILSNTINAVSDIQSVISRGYRIHTSCTNVPSVVPIQECGYYSCYTTTETVYNQVCNEIPVAIDGDLEQKKLARYQEQLTSARAGYSRTWDLCYSTVFNMSAESAYEVYRRREL